MREAVHMHVCLLYKKKKLSAFIWTVFKQAVFTGNWMIVTPTDLYPFFYEF